MTLDELKDRLQRHLTDGLVLIIGSGLSCAEGLPGMGQLATLLQREVPRRVAPIDAALWGEIEKDLAASGLEGALLKHAPSAALEELISRIIVELIAPAESKSIREVFERSRTLRFSRLLPHLLKPETGIPVITTNYDRLIEGAAELAGIGVDSMFCGSFCGILNEKESRLSFCRNVTFRGKLARYHYQPRIRLFKPHGSLDWFQCGGKPIRHAGDLLLPRLIITPGLNKFRAGYDSPFDIHRDRANAEVDRAARFLAIGYGFNDDHLETHLNPKIASGTPTVLLTHQLTPNAVHLARSYPNVLAIEFETGSGIDGSHVISGTEDCFFPGVALWDLNGLIDEVLKP